MQDFLAHPMSDRFLSSVILALMLLFLHIIGGRYLGKLEAPDSQTRRRWLVSLRNACILLLLAGFFVIWATQLRTLAFSLVAFAAAIVIALKEIILCLSGGMLRTISRSISIGDRIEIKDFRGDVIDMTLLTTRILEIGPGERIHQRTGRVIVIPNSLFLSESVRNETFTDDFVLHVFEVVIKLTPDWERAESILLRAALEECAPWIEEARVYMKNLSRLHNLDVANVEPRVNIVVTDPEKLSLLLRLPVPTKNRGRVEQEIVRRFLREYVQAVGGEGEKTA